MSHAIEFLMSNYQSIITDLVGIMTGLVALFALIPGDQPEKFLKGVLDVITKLSRK